MVVGVERVWCACELYGRDVSIYSDSMLDLLLFMTVGVDVDELHRLVVRWWWWWVSVLQRAASE